MSRVFKYVHKLENSTTDDKDPRGGKWFIFKLAVFISHDCFLKKVVTVEG